MLSLTKIAKELGISRTTISLVLNGKAKESRICASTAERIYSYCAQQNYLPNIHARRMNQRIVKNLMFLLNVSCVYGDDTAFGDYNINRILEGISMAAAKEDFAVTLQLFQPGSGPERIFNNFRDRAVDGMVYYGMDIPEDWGTVLREEGRRVVGIAVSPGNFPCVNVNNFLLFRQLAEHLLAQGRRQFFFVAGSESSYPGHERYRGFRQALTQAGIPFDENKALVSGHFCESGGYQAVRDYLASGARPQAIVCANDRMAIGALRALTELKISVPEDIAVCGADNINLSQYVTPKLTTIENLAYDMGFKATELLLRQVRGERVADVVLDGKVIYRESSGD